MGLSEIYRYFDKNYGGFEPADYCPVTFSYLGYFGSRCDEYGSIDSYENHIFEPEYGKSSFCFQSNIRKNTSHYWRSDDHFEALCYEVKECNKDSLSYTIGIFSSDNFTCSNATSRQIYSIENYSGKIVCPPYWRICGGTEICNDPYVCDAISKNSNA